METITTAAAPTATESTTAETGQSSENSAVQETTETQPQPQEKRLEKFKFKIDGVESEEEIDLSDKEGLTKQFQLARAAEKRIAAANSDRKKAFEILKAYESGDLLRNHPKAREMAESFLLKELEDEMMDPKDKALRDYKNKLSKYEEKEASDKKSLEQQAAEQKERGLIDSFSKTITDAISKTGLPATPTLAKEMAYMLSKNLELGLSLTADDLAQEVKKGHEINLKNMISGMDGDQLISIFGEDVAKKIRKYDVNKLKAMQNNASQKPLSTSAKAPKNDGRPMTIDEWKEQNNRRISE